MRGVLLVMLVGCGFAPAMHATDGGIDSSMPIDTIDADPSCTSYSDQFDTCTTGSGSNADLVLTGANTYDTEANTLTQPGGIVTNPPHVVVTTPTGMVDVLFVGNFTLTAGTLRVKGKVPFGLASTGTVTLDGEIDLSSNGAGARSDALCGSATLTPSVGGKGANDTGGGGGGGGGGHQGGGGDGEAGDKDGNSQGGQSEPGLGGLAIAKPAGILGGCDGGTGGDGSAGTGGAAGDGGGAIVIAAKVAITISNQGAIDVGGGGGHHGSNNGGGGGGGGSGGMILLEAPLTTVAGSLTANGGGGGEGADGSDGKNGDDATLNSNAAAGGTGGAGEGGDGGDGGAGGQLAGDPATSFKNGGGGGGGGGVGFIAISGIVVTSGGVISPARSAWP